LNADIVYIARMRPAARVVTIGLLATAVIACSLLVNVPDDATGGDSREDAGDAPSGPASTILTACRTYAETHCRRTTGCAPALVELFFGGLASCVELSAERCVAELVAPDVAMTAADIDRCVPVVTAQSCADIVDRNPPKCNVPGKRPLGSPCMTDFQCAAGACGGRNTLGCGTCRVLAKEGEACGECERDLRCVAGTCKRLGVLGVDCDATRPCSVAFRCSGGKCAQYAGAGESCTAPSDCETGRSFYCSLDAGCASFSFVPPEERCGVVGNRVFACAGGQCAGPDGGERCVGYVDAGKRCGALPEPSCFLTLYCAAGQCALPNDALCAR
jgi:hypothetical protein